MHFTMMMMMKMMTMMIMSRMLSVAVVALALGSVVSAFSPILVRAHQGTTISSSTLLLADDPLAEIPDDRKASLFEAMLRDLQVENVPLLGCDADQVHTLQAALWTTMAELSEQEDNQKACLVLENIPMAALQMFVDDFLVLKTQLDQMEQLPELERVTASLVGKGLGPAVLLEVTKTKSGEKANTSTVPVPDEIKCSAAMKAFMDRVVIGGEGETMIGLGDEGSAAPIQYRFSSSKNVCAMVASFWNCVCEMLSVPDADLGTLCLQLPSVESHERFAAVSQLLSRSLCLYKGDAVFSLVHFHPEYDRSKISPIEKPAFGHLPPISWLGPMLKANGDSNDLSDAALVKSNFQRRSPVTAINIVRNSLLGDPKIVMIELEGGSATQASGLETYCPNTIKLAATEEALLQKALDMEIDILTS